MSFIGLFLKQKNIQLIRKEAKNAKNPFCFYEEKNRRPQTSVKYRRAYMLLHLNSDIFEKRAHFSVPEVSSFRRCCCILLFCCFHPHYIEKALWFLLCDFLSNLPPTTRINFISWWRQIPSIVFLSPLSSFVVTFRVYYMHER